MEWIDVKDRLPELDAENCCMDEEDFGRYSTPVLVFDEMNGEVLRAIRDRTEWVDAGSEDVLYDVTHWMRLPEPPTK